MGLESNAKSNPQQARAIRTRERLLAATFRSLVARGFAGTTTHEVCRRAKVSRGTLLYHFQTRAQLLAASLESIIERRMAEFRREVDALSPGERTGARIVDLLWDQIEKPANSALVELIVAARTDAALRAKVRPMMARLNAQMERIFADLFPLPDDADRETVLTHAFAPHFAMFLLNGLHLAQIYGQNHLVQPAKIALARRAAFLDSLGAHISKPTGGPPPSGEASVRGERT